MILAAEMMACHDYICRALKNVYIIEKVRELVFREPLVRELILQKVHFHKISCFKCRSD